MKKLIMFLVLSAPAFGETQIANRTSVITQTVVSVSQSTSQTNALAVNPYRKWLYIRNMDASLPIYLSYSGNVTGTGASAGSTIKIAAGAAYEPLVAPTNKVVLFSVSGAVSASLMSGN